VVLVVGRGQTDADTAVHVTRASDRGVPLLMLTLGYPVNERQRSYIARAIDRAFEARAQLDARILARAADLADLVAATDEVTVVAAGRDERRIGSVLARLPS
jgi:hypothetical protein